MANRQYSDYTRAEAVRRVVDEGHPAAVVAREHSVSVTTVQRWVSDSHVISAALDDAVPTEDSSRRTRINSALRKLREIETELQYLLKDS